MKKILSLAAAALLLASCNGSAHKAETKSDSLNLEVSRAMGELYGYGITDQMKSDSTFNVNDFLAGIEMGLAVDTANQSKLNGLELGINLRKMQKQIMQNQKVALDVEVFMEEFKKAAKKDSMPNMQELEMNLMSIMQEASAEAKRNDPVAQKNLKDGEEFAAKKLQEGYSKTESGLVYKVLKEGEGATFIEGANIELTYEGKLIDGKVFDKSPEGQTRTMNTNSVIPGFREALLMMKPGMEMEVVIPSNLGYGAEGAGHLIGPNSTLVFTIKAVGLAGTKK